MNDNESEIYEAALEALADFSGAKVDNVKADDLMFSFEVSGIDEDELEDAMSEVECEFNHRYDCVECDEYGFARGSFEVTGYFPQR